MPAVPLSRRRHHFVSGTGTGPASLMRQIGCCCRESIMLSANHWRLAVSALAATILSSAPLRAQPLAMNDPRFSLFPARSSSSDARARAAGLCPRARDRAAGRDACRASAPGRDLHTGEAPGTIVIDTPNTYLYLRARRRPRDPLRHRRRPRGLHLGRHADASTRRPEWPDWHPPPEMIAAPALSAALHGRRPRQPARRPRHVSRQLASIASTAPTRRTPSAQRVSSGCIRLTNEDVGRPLQPRVRSAPRSWCCR